MKIIPNQVTRTVARQILLFKKQSPHILFGAGVAGMVGSTVLACRATLKLGDVVDELQEDVNGVKALSLDNKDLAYAYGKGTYKICRLYAPAIAVGVASIGALTGSHVTLSRRNASLTAAYAAVSKAYEDYRGRVKEALGEDNERDIYHAVKQEAIPGDGNKKSLENVADPNKWSPYARFFDEGSPNWQKNAELNRLFVQCQQNYANHLLQARGHVFLNEIYDMLGIERSQAGQVVGWVIGDKGDNYIDFGIFEARNADFGTRERSILLDFNVDGVIYDKI